VVEQRFCKPSEFLGSRLFFSRKSHISWGSLSLVIPAPPAVAVLNHDLPATKTETVVRDTCDTIFQLSVGLEVGPIIRAIATNVEQQPP
jgi:hypothetical protein